MPANIPAPRMLDPHSAPRLGWGVVGTGIAGKFVGALHAHTSQRAIAVVARDRNKTAKFASQYGIPCVYESVDALVLDPKIDVVYIATPHSSHREVALSAIAAGKHVLIEKPIALSASEAREILAAARRADVLATEAMWTRYLPQSDVIRQVLDSGVLGEISLVRSSFGFYMPEIPGHRLWDPALGGGAMLDVGVYPVSFSSSIIGDPITISAGGTVSSSGVDASAAIRLEAAGGAQALLSASLQADVSPEAALYGSSGRLEVLAPFFGPSAIRMTLGQFGVAETAEWRDEVADLYDGMAHQATAFATYVGQNLRESPMHTHTEIITTMETVEEIRRQVLQPAHSDPQGVGNNV
ncbi:Gfo/Idh/MocA family oxidoreductase [Pseudarthrobacter sp. R1]|uniref:Gfo/Idh/MocA family protein n=1 Tax=Pseudarthrobacter sp. R1 TaxID=2944934 RepID=UPI00210AD435|nr:Gfo/Idh/MocA family oxidoreductase [Pseudarthrobacter sp. R1]MCQ6271029.1 Gfo/Idh/MocA family oxidoreductase [Pseudarthrobacter sp. R1]